MSANKFYILSFLVLISVIGCEKAKILPTKDQPDQSNRIDTVKVLTSDRTSSFNKYVVLYDQSDYLIKTQLSTFISNLYGLSGYYQYSDYLTLVNKVIQDANQSDRLYMKDYVDSHSQKYVLAHYLNIGQCYILSKSDNKPVPKIIMETWSYYCGPLCGAGGRKFYIKDKIFLELTDWISK